MGRDKATLPFDSTTLSRRIAAVLSLVTSPCLEVGSGVSGLQFVLEDVERKGPLVAIANGSAWLASHDGESARYVVTLACDLPLLTPQFLRWLIGHPSSRSVVPVVDGYPQPLCARWARSDLDLATLAVEQGATSMRAFMGAVDPELLHASQWARVAPPAVLEDIDTPADWRRLVEQTAFNVCEVGVV